MVWAALLPSQTANGADAKHFAVLRSIDPIRYIVLVSMTYFYDPVVWTVGELSRRLHVSVSRSANYTRPMLTELACRHDYMIHKKFMYMTVVVAHVACDRHGAGITE